MSVACDDAAIHPIFRAHQRISGYQLIRHRGRGGVAEVWEAESPAGFRVALKLVHLSTDLRAGELRALKITRDLRHASLLAIYGTWQVENLLIISMELAERSLWDRFLEARAQGLRGIPRSELLGYLDSVAEGIDYLNAYRHSVEGQQGVGIQHRDLKPQNILLFGDCAKVADFGMARIMEQGVTSHTGPCTLPYAAPEYFGGQTSRQSDQYALAVTYCQLRGGTMPFPGTTAQIVVGHLCSEPDLSGLPETERPAVARALAKSPNDRWPDCRSFVDALKSLREAEGGRVPDTLPGEPRDIEPEHDWESIYLSPSDPFLKTADTDFIPQDSGDSDTRVEVSGTDGDLEESGSPCAGSALVTIFPTPEVEEAPGTAMWNGEPGPPAPSPSPAGAHVGRDLRGLAASAGLVAAAGLVALWLGLRAGGTLIPARGKPIAPVASQDPPTANPTGTLSLASTAAPEPSVPLRLVATTAAEPRPPVTALESGPYDRPISSAAGGESRREGPASSDPAPTVRPGPPIDPKPDVPRNPPGSRATTDPPLARVSNLPIGASATMVPSSSMDSSPDPSPSPGIAPSPTRERDLTLPRLVPPWVESGPPAIGEAVSVPQAEPSALHISLPERLVIRAGERASLTVSVERGGVSGPVAIRFEGLPNGVVLPDLTIPEGSDRAEAEVAAGLSANAALTEATVIGSAGPAHAEAKIRLEVQPSLGLALRRRGDTYRGLRQWDQARDAYGEAIRLDPNDASALDGRGLAHLGAGRFDRALADFAGVVRLRPDATAYRHLGLAHYRAGAFERAVAAFGEAIELDPNDAWTYNTRGLAFRALGRFPNAISDYNEVLRLRPKVALVHYNRGVAYLLLGDNLDAIADFDMAIQLDPGHAQAYRRRAEAHERRGDQLRAKADRAQAARLDKGDAASRSPTAKDASKVLTISFTHPTH